jgi:hypothetical protein
MRALRLAQVRGGAVARQDSTGRKGLSNAEAKAGGRWPVANYSHRASSKALGKSYAKTDARSPECQKVKHETQDENIGAP